jgi:hypothetical protein
MPKIGSEQEYKDKRNTDGFGTLREDEYVFEVVGYQEKAGTYHEKFNPDSIGSIIISCAPRAFAEDEDEELVDDKGNPLNPDKYVNVFARGTLDKPKFGFGPSGASFGRRLVWSAFGVPVRDPLNFDWDDLIGKTFIGSVIMGDNGYEKIETVRPHRRAGKKAAPAAKRPAPLVEAAAEVFGEDAESEY